MDSVSKQIISPDGYHMTNIVNISLGSTIAKTSQQSHAVIY